jgi:hypothetical protein
MDTSLSMLTKETSSPLRCAKITINSTSPQIKMRKEENPYLTRLSTNTWLAASHLMILSRLALVRRGQRRADRRSGDGSTHEDDVRALPLPLDTSGGGRGHKNDRGLGCSSRSCCSGRGQLGRLGLHNNYRWGSVWPCLR